MTKETNLNKILVEMMATSPSRNWIGEAEMSKEQLSEQRKENVGHIKDYAKVISTKFNLSKKEKAFIIRCILLTYGQVISLDPKCYAKKVLDKIKKMYDKNN